MKEFFEMVFCCRMNFRYGKYLFAGIEFLGNRLLQTYEQLTGRNFFLGTNDQCRLTMRFICQVLFLFSQITINLVAREGPAFFSWLL